MDVSFEVLLRGADPGGLATVESIAAFRPSAETFERVRRWLTSSEVVCHPTTFSLVCSAPQVRFEELFGVRLVASEDADGPPLTMIGMPCWPDELAELVESVTLSRAPNMFG